MAEIFKVAPRGKPLKARAGDWIWVHGVAEGGHSAAFTAATVWVVNHNLGRYPAAVAVRTVGGIVCDVEIKHVSANQLHVNFDVPTAGVVEVS